MDEPRKKVVAKLQAYTNKAEDYSIKQLEVNEEINKATLVCKDKVEHLFETLVMIQDNLKWNEHAEAQTKTANKRMFHVSRLKKLKMESKSNVTV